MSESCAKNFSAAFLFFVTKQDMASYISEGRFFHCMDFEQVYDLYFKEVLLYIRSLQVEERVAEEVVQETFFKAFKAIDQFDGAQDIRAWLFTIARNTYFSHYNKNKRYMMREIEGPPEGSHITLTKHLANEESAFAIHQFLHAMKEPYKEVFSLRVFGELPFDKIGKIFGKSAGWARVTFYRARKQIQYFMEENNYE